MSSLLPLGTFLGAFAYAQAATRAYIKIQKQCNPLRVKKAR